MVTPEPLDRLIELLTPLLGPPAGEPVHLTGGITNLNYRMRMGDGEFVIRVTNPAAGLLEIDRVAELIAVRAAAAIGVGAEVAALLPEQDCLVCRFIPGRPIPPEELRTPTHLRAVGATLAQLHASGTTLPSTFNPFRVVENYARTAAARGAPERREFPEASRVATEIERSLQGAEHLPVMCHNDLLNANFLHDGKRIRIVDWEYAGMGDRYFDLGNFSINHECTETDDVHLLAGYFGEPVSDRRIGIVRLMRIMSDFREAMWGVVQSVNSVIEFDYEAYASRHFARLLHSAADPRFASWTRVAHDQ